MNQSKALQDFIFISKYARTQNGKKENWEQAVNRVMSMHYDFITNKFEIKEGTTRHKEFMQYFNLAWEGYLNQEAIGAQRSLQWGGEQLLKHQMKMYNCTSTYLNRVDFFHELMYVLLCGAGAGYSVQKHHVAMLPKVKGALNETKTYMIPDSIEGWSMAIKELVYAYFYGTENVHFDYSLIRPKGAYISGGFKAPGPEPLRKAIEKIREILSKAKGRKLRPFEAHRMATIIADAVVSGGVRRSALIALFSLSDEEMMTCKTGDWYLKYPELARANNSVVILPKNNIGNVFKNVKEYGEPGIAFLKNKEYLYNPCFEVGMMPVWEENGGKDYGWSTCNLSEINGNRANTLENFKRSATIAAILGTFQACYTDFKVLGSTTKKIIDRDALIGVGITGMTNNPDILFNPEYQKQVAKEVVKTNIELAKLIGINPAARTTVVKPSGNSSQMLGTSSGIHPFHAKRYIRNVQVNKEEVAAQIYQEINPKAVEESVWSKGNDLVISFPVTVKENAIFKKDLSALEFLEKVRLTQENWIEYGTNFDHPSTKKYPSLRHNVSNTISVKPYEWEMVEDYLDIHRDSFVGISMLPSTGDTDYQQAPYTEVFDEKELAQMYGAGAILASGLIVDGIHAFGNLWEAIETGKGNGESLVLRQEEISKILIDNMDEKLEFKYNLDGVIITDINAVISNMLKKVEKKKDWVRRFKKFAVKYMDGDIERTGRCLKHVNLFHKWKQIEDSKTILWDEMTWPEEIVEAGRDTASICYGGACEI